MVACFWMITATFLVRLTLAGYLLQCTLWLRRHLPLDLLRFRVAREDYPRIRLPIRWKEPERQPNLGAGRQRQPYGTTCCGGPGGGGTAFKVQYGSGAYHVLHSFSGYAGPSGSLIRDKAGNLYGMTYLGGAHGVGLGFQIDALRQRLDLHFTSRLTGPDGIFPRGSLLLDAKGNLYGKIPGGSSAGVVFEITP